MAETRLYSPSLLTASLVCLSVLAFPALRPWAQTTSGSSAVASDAASILNRDQAGPLFPSTVFYAGRVAPIQARNSGGLRLSSGKLILAALVDTSGYASSVQEKYQGYLLTEVQIRLGDKTLPPGAYGFGFISGDRVVVTDLGGSDVLTAPTARDPALARPTPLQVLPEASKGHVRLYLGRSFVQLETHTATAPH